VSPSAGHVQPVGEAEHGLRKGLGNLSVSGNIPPATPRATWA